MENKDLTADLIKATAMFMVILIHTVATTLLTHPVGSTEWFWANIFDSFSRVAPPLFFMISGAFLLSKKEPIGQFFSKRMSRLLIPALFWTFLYLLLRVVFGGYRPSPGELITDILTGDIYYHLWFINAIVIIYALTPALRVAVVEKSAKNKTLLMSLFFVLSWLGVYFLLFEQYLTNIFAYLGYFIFGSLYGHVGKDNSSTKMALIAFVVYVTASVFTAFGTYQLSELYVRFNGIYYGYSTINVAVASCALFIFLNNLKIHHSLDNYLKNIASCGLGIYLLHPLLIQFLRIDRIQIAFRFEELLLCGAVFLLAFAIIHWMQKTAFGRKLV